MLLLVYMNIRSNVLGFSINNQMFFTYVTIPSFSMFFYVQLIVNVSFNQLNLYFVNIGVVNIGYYQLDGCWLSHGCFFASFILQMRS